MAAPETGSFQRYPDAVGWVLRDGCRAAARHSPCGLNDSLLLTPSSEDKLNFPAPMGGSGVSAVTERTPAAIVALCIAHAQIRDLPLRTRAGPTCRNASARSQSGSEGGRGKKDGAPHMRECGTLPSSCRRHFDRTAAIESCWRLRTSHMASFLAELGPRACHFLARSCTHLEPRLKQCLLVSVRHKIQCL
jgi:hypothetical protein